MSETHPAATTDRLGMLCALIVHLMGGGTLTDIDQTQYPDLVLRVIDKVICVVEKRFDGNGSKLFPVLLMQVALAKLAHKNDMLAIESWLDARLREVGISPRQFNRRN